MSDNKKIIKEDKSFTVFIIILVIIAIILGSIGVGLYVKSEAMNAGEISKWKSNEPSETCLMEYMKIVKDGSIEEICADALPCLDENQKGFENVVPWFEVLGSATTNAENRQIGEDKVYLTFDTLYASSSNDVHKHRRSLNFLYCGSFESFKEDTFFTENGVKPVNGYCVEIIHDIDRNSTSDDHIEFVVNDIENTIGCIINREDFKNEIKNHIEDKEYELSESENDFFTDMSATSEKMKAVESTIVIEQGEMVRIRGICWVKNLEYINQN